MKLGTRFEEEEKETKPMRKQPYIFLVIIGLWALGVALPTQVHAQFDVKGKLCIPDVECKSDSVTFSDTLKTSTAWLWDFGDPGSGTQNTSTKVSAKHLYQTPGPYTVTLTRTVNGVPQIVTKTINIGVPPPQFPGWRRDTMICKEDLGKLILNPYPSNAPSGAKYLWFPNGDSTQTMRVDSSGCYSVEVTNAEGCTYEDRINVKVCMEPELPPDSKWYFGTNAGINFVGGGEPQPITDSQINTSEGAASISNAKGQLLFYTDGTKIYDKNGGVMPSKDGSTTPLAGSSNSTQSALIVPKPICRGCEYLYYVFTTSDINGTKQLSYSLVDMRGNGGKGEIVEKNIPLNQGSLATERIAAVRNDRDSTYWVVTHDYNSNAFKVYHVTKAGIEGPTAYPLGTLQNTPSQAEGYMKFSTPDSTGQKLAIIVPGPPRNLVQIYTFNDTTGQLSGPTLTLDLGKMPPKAYGVEFSSDGTKMYVTLQKDDSDTTLSRLYQYDISLGDSARIADSRIPIDSSATEVYGALQRGPDGRIYMAVKGSEYLGVINNPDEDSKEEVKFELQGIHLGGKLSQLGLPNFVALPPPPPSGPSISYKDTCSNQPTTFNGSPRCEPMKGDQYIWNFGDGSASMTGQQVQHTYREAGTYTVTLTQRHPCRDTVMTQRITIIATPDPIKLRNIPDTCVPVLTLDAGVVAEQYEWYRDGRPFARTKTITLQPLGGSGTYRVVASNGILGQCSSRGSAEVRIRRPPAYSLGSDTSLCVGVGSVVLDARPTVTQWDEFLWSTGEKTELITVTKPGAYISRVYNRALQCFNEDTIQVRPSPKARMQATLTPPTGCTTRDGRIVIGSITPTGNYTFSWFGEPNDTPLTGTGNTLASLGEGTYKVRLTGNPTVCPTDSSFTLRVVKNLRLQPTVVDARCTIPNAGAINLSTLAGTPTRYVWTNATGGTVGTNAPIISNLLPGKYNVQVTDAGGCDTTLRDITVGVLPEKFLSLGPDREKCVGDTALLVPTLPNIAGNQYQWSTGETTNRITVSRAGTYSLTVTNSVTGCTDTDNFVYSLAPRPVYDLNRDVGLCDLDVGAMATLIIRPTTPNLRYRWFPPLDATTLRVTVDQVGTYRVSITSPASCEVTDSVQVVVRCEPRLFIPDAFSPNADGQNDLLDVYGDHLSDFELKIFNRWGEVIFHTNDMNEKWDGKYRGALYPPMTYPYVVSFKSKFFPDRPRISQRGAVTLLR